MGIAEVNKNELIEYLLNYAFRHDISYILIKIDSYVPSASNKNTRQMVINMNWRNKDEIPFVIGHEIGHLMLEDIGIKSFLSFSGKLSEEKQADLFSLKLLYDYSFSRDDNFSEPAKFVYNYGIPQRMLNPAKELFAQGENLVY